MKKIVIIGGGPGGYVAAIKAAQVGAEVVLIDKGEIGGTCLNKGCIPTKALYRSAEVIDLAKRGNEFGIIAENISVNFKRVQERKSEIVEKLKQGIYHLLKGHNIKIIHGEASFSNEYKVKVYDYEEETTYEIEGDYCIIATGSKPNRPSIQGIELERVMTTEEFLEIDTLPSSLLIVGGGVIGIEFATIMNAFGVSVTIIEVLDGILTTVDHEVSKRLKVMLKRKGVKILTSSKVERFDCVEDRIMTTYVHKDKEAAIVTDLVLVSTGRSANTGNLGLEHANIVYTKSGITIDNDYKTNVPNVYAIGDVNGESQLAHAASNQGIKVIEDIMNLTDAGDKFQDIVPNCIFTFPEVAMAGITEKEAKLTFGKGNYKVSKFLFSANGKALTLGEGEGFVKIISDLENRILGVHILGPHASDLITEGTLMIRNELDINLIKHTIHAHPTLSEAFHEALLGLTHESLHKLP